MLPAVAELANTLLKSRSARSAGVSGGRQTATNARIFSSVILLAAVISAPPAGALDSSDRAGTVDGNPVTVAEIDSLLDGAITRGWIEIDRIFRASARAICRDHELTRVARDRAISLLELKSRLWAGTTPDAEMIARFRVDDPTAAIGNPTEIGHALHVRRYRAALKQLAKADELTRFRIGTTPETLDGEPSYPKVVATCRDHTITRKEIETFASFPLYRRRAGLVSAICRQFDAETSDRLLSTGAGVDRDQKASAATDAKCSLEYPEPSVAVVRGSGPAIGPQGSMPVRYFGTFNCRHCKESLEVFLRAREQLGDRIRIEFRHHFPDPDWKAFTKARAGVCADRQGAFWDYVRHQIGPGAQSDPAKALALDREAFSLCMTDARSAVPILDDLAEARRLGFEDALPSWVIGVRSIRGHHGIGILAEMVDQ